MLRFSKKDRQDEFLNLVHEHQGIVIKVCRIYTKTKEDFDDLYQEVLIQGWQSYQRFKGNSKFSTWLYKVCLNTALTRKKADEVSGKHIEIEEAERLHSASGNQFESQDLLQKVLSVLSDGDKAFILLFMDGYSYEEIAEVMGVTVNHTGVKINRIKNKLKTLLGNQ